MNGHPERLSGRRGYKDITCVQHDSVADEVAKVPKLGTDEGLERHTAPFLRHEEILAQSQPSQPRGEAAFEFGDTVGARCGLPGYDLGNGQEVLGTVADFTHKYADMLFALFAIGNISGGSNHAHGTSVLEFRLAGRADPSLLAIGATHPELDKVLTNSAVIDGAIECFLGAQAIIGVNGPQHLITLRLGSRGKAPM